MTRYYPGMAVTFDTEDRVVPGFIFINSVQSLSVFTKFVVNLGPKSRASDMTLIARFKKTREGGGLVEHLPVMPCSTNESDARHTLSVSVTTSKIPMSQYCNNWKEFGYSLFDAAAMGQYLGGVNPQNPGGSNSIGFINEMAIYNCSRYEFQLRRDHLGRFVPFATFKGQDMRLINLHIHSK